MVLNNKDLLIQNVRYKRNVNSEYENAIKCLNALPSNKTAIKQSVLQSPTKSNSLEITKKYLQRVGITEDQIDKLSVIHVSGTKGKGSVCAFSECILRHHGYKTGFFSSPHMIAVRERIRINGTPVSQDVFTKHFFDIYNKLQAKKEHEQDMPAYFCFLTILCFDVFIAQKVDVAILEVGIGGEFDSTNAVRNTAIAGITSLGFDHEAILGNTIDLIAWNKAGIMKKSSKVFTVQQTPEAMQVLEDRSIERECSLSVVPNFNDYKFDGDDLKLGINGSVQKLNASLAIQLAHCWLENYGRLNNKQFLENNLYIPDKTKQGLINCKWPGRFQVVELKNASVYLDGAHTIESIELCVDWFKSCVPISKQSNKVLIFNKTGSRDPGTMLKKLQSINFDYVYFVPNVSSNANLADQSSPNISSMQNCETHKQIWLNLLELKMCKPHPQKVEVKSTIEDVFKNLPTNKYSDILITGSLHLVGASLVLLDPELESF